MRLVDLDDERHTYIGSNGEYERWSIDPEVPAIQPRKKGKWIPHESVFGGSEEMVYTCDQCGHNIGFHTEKYCPNCGCDMWEGDADGDI